MSEFLATAAIKIVPDIRGFQALLRTQVKQSLSTAGIFKVPITPELTKFRAAFKAELRSTPISVPVVPDITGFRELLIARVNTASAGVAVTVPVVPSKAPAIAAGTGVKAGAASTEKLTKDTIQLTAAEQRLSAQEAILTRISAQRALATMNMNRTLAASVTLEERVALTRSALQSITAAETAAENTLATALAKGATARAGALKLRLTEIQSDKASITTKAREAELELAVASARERSSLAQARSAAIDLSASVLRKENNALIAIEAELELAAAEAKLLGNTARGIEIAAIETEIAARRSLIATELAGIKSSQKAASQQAFAARGAASSGLSLLGIRGATLAANAGFLAGAAAFAIFAKSVGSAAKLETELNVFRLTADATATEMERVRQVAIQLGADITLPAVSAGDAASAFTSLAKAGLAVEDSVDGARGVLQLATAAQIENAEATELVASALNSFSLNGDEATHVADLLTGAANAAQGSITDMGIALQQSSAVARQAGLSLEDTVAFITLLAKNGIRGSDAGTSLRTSLLRLIAPTEDAAKQLAALNISLLDVTTGAIRPEVFAELATALERLGTTARNQVLRKIFGQDAIRAAVIFGREGTKGLNDVREATNQAGLAAELAAARTAGFAGKIEALRNSLATLGTNLGGIAIGPMGLFADGIATIVADMNAFVRSVERFNATFDPLVKRLLTPFDFTGLFSGGTTAIGEMSDGAQLLIDKMGIAALSIGHVSASLAQAANQSEILAEALGPGLASENLQGMVNEIEQVSKSLQNGDANAQALAARLQNVLRFIQEFGRRPTTVELIALLDAGTTQADVDKLLLKLGRNPVKIQAAIDQNSEIFLTQQLFVLGEKGRVAWQAGFGNLPLFDFSQIPDAGANPFPPLGAAERLTPEQIANRLMGFDDRVNRAQIAGNVQAEIDALREQKAFINQQLARPDIAGAGRGPLLEARRKLEGESISTQSDIDSLLKDRVDDAKTAADKIQEAKDEADRLLANAFGLETGAAENRILAAAATPQLADDIKAQEALRVIIKKQTAIGANIIHDQEERARFLQTQNAELLRVNQKIKDLEKEQILGIVGRGIERAEDKVEAATLTANLNDDIRAQIGLRKKVTAAIRKLQAAGGDTIAEVKNLIEKRKAIRQEIADLLREQRARISESLQLDVEFADLGEREGKSNAAARIRARQRLIVALKKEQALVAKGSVEWKRLRNQIAQEQQAIADLKKETSERNDAFRALTFLFLQTQQGFAANLLGNLIPAGISGLNNVSGPSGSGGGSLISSTPGGARGGVQGTFGLGGGILQEAGIAEASKAKGPSSGQLSELIEVNRRMLAMLARIAGDAKHPEAKRTRINQRTAMDLQGPGV